MFSPVEKYGQVNSNTDVLLLLQIVNSQKPMGTNNMVNPCRQRKKKREKSIVNDTKTSVIDQNSSISFGFRVF